MLEIINSTSQTVTANNTISLGNTTISDNANRVVLTNGDTIQINTAGKYIITGQFNLQNTAESVANQTIQMYVNGSAFGVPITATVPVSGYEEVIISKTVRAIPATYGNTVNVTFVTSSGATVVNSTVDVFKRS